jgi:uncharacterized protein (DUF934 family)
MPLVKGGKIVPDSFQRVEDGAAVPEHGPVLVPAARFLADHEELARHDGAVGVIWPNNRSIAELAPHIDKLAMIALAFPSFRDGRAYSQARLLRERYGFRGELRATGQVLRDQFVFLLRAGFDAFEVVKLADAEAFEEAARRYSVFFQPTGDGRVTVARARVGDASHPVQASNAGPAGKRVPA